MGKVKEGNKVARWERWEGNEVARWGRWESGEVRRWGVPSFVQGWRMQADSKILCQEQNLIQLKPGFSEELL